MMLWLVLVGLPAAPAHDLGRRELQSCGSATFVAVSYSECPSSSVAYYHLGACYDSVACGELCWSWWGDCGTSRDLNNCLGRIYGDAYNDIYRRSCPSPTPRPTPRDDEDDDDDLDVVALAVSLCVVGAFLAVCGILYVKYPARAKQGFTLVKARCAAMCRAHAKQGFSPVKARRAALTARNRLAMWGGFDLSTATMGLLMSV